MTVPLNLTFTPLVEGIQEVRVSVVNDGDDMNAVSWLGLTDTRISLENRDGKDAYEPIQLQLTALMHTVGVFDLNHLQVHAVLAGNHVPISVRVKDEMIVQLV